MSHVRDAAAFYLSQGWTPVPIPFREKGPKIPGWQSFTNSQVAANFGELFPEHQDRNVGVVLGDASGRLVDVDCDCIPAVRFADLLLPTTAIFGRASRRRSHRLYVGETQTKQFKDPVDGSMIIEIRSNGGQTVFPGSVHPSGESIEWDPESSAPVAFDMAELHRLVAAVAAFSVIAKHWPDKGRHEAQLAFAGALLSL